MVKGLRSGQFANAPLIYTLAQVVFSHVLKISDYVPEIQERLRKAGFPKLQESITQGVQFQASSGISKISQKIRWDFSNKNNTQCLSLSENFLVLHTSDYTNFEDFSETLNVALSILKDVANPELIERLGLRYVDLVRLKKGEKFKEYLKPGLLGFPVDKISNKEVLTRCETVAQTEYGYLVSKSVWHNDGTFLPPDIGAEGLRFDETKKPKTGEIICLLDFDHFSTETRDFIVKDVLTSYSKMHDFTGKVFREAVTEHAIKTWNPTNSKKKKS